MGDIVRKLAPYSLKTPEQYRATEAWLEELAQEGLVLQEAGVLWMHFRRSPPIRLRYRMEGDAKGLNKNTHRRSALKQAGWQYAAWQGGKNFYYSEDWDKAWPPWNEDPDKQSAEARGGIWLSDVLPVVLTLMASAGLFWWQYASSPAALQDFLTLPWSAVYTELALYVLAFVCLPLAYLWRLCQRLRRRKVKVPPLVHSAAQSRRAAKQKGLFLLLKVLVLVSCFVGGLIVGRSDSVGRGLPLSAETALPMPRIEQISSEQNVEATLLHAYPAGPFLREWIWLTQTGDDFSYRARSYAMRNETLAQTLVQVLSQTSSAQSQQSYTPAPTVGNLCVYVCREGDWQYLLLQGGCLVLELSYRGGVDIQEHMSVFLPYFATPE